MPVKVRLNLALKNGVHSTDAIKIQFSGPRASNISIDELKKGVCQLVNLPQFCKNPKDEFKLSMITGHYRLQQPHTVFLRIAAHCHLTKDQIYARSAAMPDFKIVDKTNATLVHLRISDPTVEPARIFLNYCPTNIIEDQDDFTAILTAILPQRHHDKTTLIRNIKDRQDRHLLLVAMPASDLKDVPHYVEYTADDGTDDRILITIPGRLPLCHICEVDTHHPSQCGKKSADQPLRARADLAVQTDQPPLKSARTQTSDDLLVQIDLTALESARPKKRTAAEQESSSHEKETTPDDQLKCHQTYTISEMKQIMPTHFIDMKDSHPRYKTNTYRLEEDYECAGKSIVFGKWSTEDGWVCYQKPPGGTSLSWITFVRVNPPNLETMSRQGGINPHTTANGYASEPDVEYRQQRKDESIKKKAKK